MKLPPFALFPVLGSLLTSPLSSPLAGMDAGGGSSALSGPVAIILVGQSNMVGRSGPIDGTLDATDSNILMWNSSTLLYETASNPLDHFDETADTVGPGLSLAKRLRQNNPAISDVLIIPAADGGTGFLARNWNRIDAEYLAAVTRAGLALTAADVLYGTSVPVAGIFDIQGEDDLDGNSGIAADDGALQGWKSQFYRAFREDVLQLDQTVPVVTGGIPPDWSETGTANTAFAAMGAFIEKWAFADPTGLASEAGDDVHYSAASARAMGERMADALDTAEASTTQLPSVPAVPSGNILFHFDYTGVADGHPIYDHANDVPVSMRRLHVENGTIEFSPDGILSKRLYIAPTVAPGANDFSVRMAITFDTVTGLQGILGNWVSDGNRRSWLFRTNDDDLQLFWSTDGANSAGSITASNVLSADTEFELEVRRESGTVGIYINGSSTAAASAAISGTLYDNSLGITVGDYAVEYSVGGGNRDLQGSIRYLTIEQL